MHEPITRTTSVDDALMFGLSDQSGFADIRDAGTAAVDTFTDARARALALERVRVVVPYNIVTLAQKQTTANAGPCKSYQGIYQWIKSAVDATPQREPLISFERRRGSIGKTHLPDPSGEYRDAVRAFVNQFPAVRLYTAWNEPNNTRTQPTGHVAMDLSDSGAYKAGRYWRNLSLVCKKGKLCVVGAGDFLDYKTFTRAYRSQYFQGMGSPHSVALWAWHPYGAIHYGAASTAAARFASFLNSAMTSGSDIWLTEGGAVAHQLATDTSAHNLDEQNADLADFLANANSPFNRSTRVKRFYYYEWAGEGKLDSGLVGQGDLPGLPASPTRPVYCTFRMYSHPTSPC